MRRSAPKRGRPGRRRSLPAGTSATPPARLPPPTAAEGPPEKGASCPITCRSTGVADPPLAGSCSLQRSCCVLIIDLLQ